MGSIQLDVVQTYCFKDLESAEAQALLTKEIDAYITKKESMETLLKVSQWDIEDLQQAGMSYAQVVCYMLEDEDNLAKWDQDDWYNSPYAGGVEVLVKEEKIEPGLALKEEKEVTSLVGLLSLPLGQVLPAFSSLQEKKSLAKDLAKWDKQFSKKQKQ